MKFKPLYSSYKSELNSRNICKVFKCLALSAVSQTALYSWPQHEKVTFEVFEVLRFSY